MTKTSCVPVLILLCACVGITALIALCIHTYATRHHDKNLEATCENIARWAREQPLSVGTYPRFQVPPHLLVPRGSEVNLVRTAGGDVVVLLKTEIGWKGNYEGVLYSTRPIGSTDIGVDAYGREEVTIPGIDANSPVIKNRVNPQFFHAHFDLG